LLKSILGLVELANQLPLAMKAWWKLHVNIFMKIAIEKGIDDIKLSQVPTSHNRNGKQSFDISHLGNWGKGLYKIKTLLLLCKTLSNQPSLVSFNRAI